MELGRYTMDSGGDGNNLDLHTRRNMLSQDQDLQWSKLFKFVWFMIGMLVGSVLHDGVFHAIEQGMK